MEHLLLFHNYKLPQIFTINWLNYSLVLTNKSTFKVFEVFFILELFKNSKYINDFSIFSNFKTLETRVNLFRFLFIILKPYYLNSNGTLNVAFFEWLNIYYPMESFFEFKII